MERKRQRDHRHIGERIIQEKVKEAKRRDRNMWQRGTAERRNRNKRMRKREREEILKKRKRERKRERRRY
jgi:hypothetical protein